MNVQFDYHQHLKYQKSGAMSFAEFIEVCIADPENALRVSSSLINDAIKYFGYEIVIRSGEPTICYSIFKDPFSRGVNAVYGQEYCIKQLVDVIEQVGKESGPNRGIVLVGPPASGKTNIVDLISLALEEYTKQQSVNIYSFYFRLRNESGQVLDIRSPFLRNPLLLFPPILQQKEGISRPREELFAYLRNSRGGRLHIPTYFHGATLDKRSMEIIQALLDNPRNQEKSLAQIIDEYVRVEQIVFSNSQGRGIANIDNLNQLKVQLQDLHLGEGWRDLLSEHLPGFKLSTYDGALVSANRGLLHIHDAFAIGTDGGPSQDNYKPLLMLLGSGKASIEGTQASIDTTVIITTNVEEMATLERQLTSQKLLDRVEKIPVNYLLDSNSEMDILRRDLANVDERYDIDPNLLRIASYYAVLTRLLPPSDEQLPKQWSDQKKSLYRAISPEQKLFIYASEPADPVKTINQLPFWHPFRNLALKLDIDVSDPDSYRNLIVVREDRVSLEASELFSSEQLALIDDEFMRHLMREHYPHEGQSGISVRQLQNTMRNTLASSDGCKVRLETFLNQLGRLFQEGEVVHHWLRTEDALQFNHPPIPARSLGSLELSKGQGDFGDFEGLVEVARALYYRTISKEITLATVNRDPADIETDLRRYLQHALLYRALKNRTFAHVMAPRFNFIDERTGLKVDTPNTVFMESLESVLGKAGDSHSLRDEIASRFLRLQESGDLTLEPGKSIVASRRDNLLDCFRGEYQQLLSHRRSIDGMDPELLKLAFVKRQNDSEKYAQLPPNVQQLVDQILSNLTLRSDYTRSMALDTVVFAIRKQVVDFAAILR